MPGLEVTPDVEVRYFHTPFETASNQLNGIVLLFYQNQIIQECLNRSGYQALSPPVLGWAMDENCPKLFRLLFREIAQADVNKRLRSVRSHFLYIEYLTLTLLCLLSLIYCL